MATVTFTGNETVEAGSSFAMLGNLSVKGVSTAFGITDPDGNLLMFGLSMESAEFNGKKRELAIDLADPGVAEPLVTGMRMVGTGLATPLLSVEGLSRRLPVEADNALSQGTEDRINTILDTLFLGDDLFLMGGDLAFAWGDVEAARQGRIGYGDDVFQGSGIQAIDTVGGLVAVTISGDVMTAGAGTGGKFGNDYISVSMSTDLVAYGDARSVAVSARGDFTFGNDAIFGGSGDDRLFGDTQADLTQGGRDMLSGGSGSDSLFGGGGNDLLYGGFGSFADVFDGGAGIDTASYRDRFLSGTLIIDLQDTAKNTLDAKGDTYFEIEIVEGSNEIDDIRGDQDGQTLRGLAGNDRLTGRGGADVLSGGANDDIIDGGTGNDRLTGGDGADRFEFTTAIAAGNNVDVITDFTPGAEDDFIALSATVFTGIAAAGSGIQGFRFRANATGEAADGNDRLIYNTSNGRLLYDADGDGAGAAIHFATLIGRPTIVADDFTMM